MQSELQRVAKELCNVLDQLPGVVAYLKRAAQRCRDNAALIATSSSPAARTASAQLDEAARRCDEAAHYASLVPSKARAWAQQMVSGARETGIGPASASRWSTPSPGSALTGGERGQGSRTRSPKIGATEALDMLKRLPTRVERLGHREKTSGLWKDDVGNEYRLISGVDRFREQADRHARDNELGDPPHALAITAHVEVKFAMYMRERGLIDETIVINKPTCDGRWSCTEMLKGFLPPGACLTVYGPDGKPTSYYGKDLA